MYQSYQYLRSLFGSESSPAVVSSSPTSHDVYRSTYSVDKTGTYRYDPNIPMYSGDFSKRRSLLIHDDREYWPNRDPSEVCVGKRLHLICRRTAGCPGYLTQTCHNLTEKTFTEKIRNEKDIYRKDIFPFLLLVIIDYRKDIKKKNP